MLVLLQQYAQREYYEEEDLIETSSRLRLVNTSDLDYYCVFVHHNENWNSSDLPFIIPIGEETVIDLTTTLTFLPIPPSSVSPQPRTVCTVGKLLFYKYNIIQNRQLIDLRDPDFEESILCVMKLPTGTPLHYDVYTVDEVVHQSRSNWRRNRSR